MVKQPNKLLFIFTIVLSGLLPSYAQNKSIESALLNLYLHAQYDSLLSYSNDILKESTALNATEEVIVHLLRSDAFLSKKSLDDAISEAFLVEAIYADKNLKPDEYLGHAKINIAASLRFQSKIDECEQQLNAINQYLVDHQLTSTEVTARYWTQMGILQLQKKSTEQANLSLKKARMLYESVPFKYPSRFLICLTNLGRTYKGLREYELTANYQDTILQLVNQFGITEHPMVMGTYIDKGNLDLALGNFESAKKWYQLSKDLGVKRYGPSHPNVGIIINNLGLVYTRTGDIYRGVIYLEESLNIKLKRLSENHPSLANAYLNLSSLKQQLNEKEEALEYANKGLEIYKSVYGEKHPSLSSIYNIKAGVYRDMGKFKESVENHQLSINALTAIDISTNIDYANALFRFANTQFIFERYDEALDNYLQAITILNKNEKVNQIQKGEYLNNLARAYIKLQKYDQADKIFSQSIIGLDSAQQELFPTITVFNGQYNYALGEVDEARQKGGLQEWEKALTSLDKALQWLEKLQLTLTEKESIQNLRSDSYLLFESLIEVNYELAKLTNDNNYLEKAFHYMERSKGFL
ncbi:MAG: tetratricopeptide repeat protein, partial [Bacteroidota bacterium]